MRLCEICGNSFAAGISERVRCPFCQSEQKGDAKPPLTSWAEACVTVNLEKGKPPVDKAMQRLKNEIAAARLRGLRALTLIHGYGSSGKGGLIREEVRKRLAFLQRRRELEVWIAGEDFESRSKRGRQLVKQYPFLHNHPDLNHGNPGVTVVILPAR